MAAWFAENAGTVVISAVLAAVLAAIVVSMYRNRKAGKASCGCGCAHCAMRGECHRSDGESPGQ